MKYRVKKLLSPTTRNPIQENREPGDIVSVEDYLAGMSERDIQILVDLHAIEPLTEGELQEEAAREAAIERARAAHAPTKKSTKKKQEEGS